MSQILKYLIGILAVILVVFVSLDIQNLEKHRASNVSVDFNASDYAAKFWNDSLPKSIENAIQVNDLLISLSENPEYACKKFGHQLGISKTWYFMLRGKGRIDHVGTEYIELVMDDNSKIFIATDFVFGNAVFVGSGKVNLNDFLNMNDFNAVSVAINQLVKEKVVSRLRNSAEVGKELEFVGAIELSEENIDLSDLLVLPVLVKLSDGKH